VGKLRWMLVVAGMGGGLAVMATAWASLRWIDRRVPDEEPNWSVRRAHGMDETARQEALAAP
jgi:hypothetical protein